MTEQEPRRSGGMVDVAYEDTGPVDCHSSIDLQTLKDKCVIITGGSSGLGEAYVTAFAEAGAFVVIADINPPRNLKPSSKFLYVKCDVSSFADQAEVFKAAVAKSPRRGIDIVIANAGIYGPDIFNGLDEDEPKETSTDIIQVNFVGVVHTTRLAGYHFHRQPKEAFDRCLILVSSIMGYLDSTGSTLYGATKHAVRGMMCVVRRKGLLRVNVLAPWFIVSTMLPGEFVDALKSQLQAQGSGFALTEDAVKAVLHIATEKTMNGRALAVVSRKDVPSGYVDLDLDDFKDGLWDKLQSIVSGLEYPKFF